MSAAAFTNRLTPITYIFFVAAFAYALIWRLTDTILAAIFTHWLTITFGIFFIARQTLAFVWLNAFTVFAGWITNGHAVASCAPHIVGTAFAYIRRSAGASGTLIAMWYATRFIFFHVAVVTRTLIRQDALPIETAL